MEARCYKQSGDNMKNYKIKCRYCEKTRTTKEELISWVCSSCTMKHIFAYGK